MLIISFFSVDPASQFDKSWSVVKRSEFGAVRLSLCLWLVGKEDSHAQ